MASPQLENGYSRISNELLIAFSMVPLGGREFRVLMLLWRFTYGWSGRKDCDTSAVQFGDIAHIGRHHGADTVRSLIKKNIVEVSRSSTGAKLYRLQKDYQRWSGFPDDGKRYVKQYAGSTVESSRIRRQNLPNSATESPEFGTYLNIDTKETTKEVVVTCAREGTKIPSLPPDIQDVVERRVSALPSPDTVMTFDSFIRDHGLENVRAAIREAQDSLVERKGFTRYIRRTLENQKVSGYAWKAKERPPGARRNLVHDLSHIHLGS